MEHDSIPDLRRFIIECPAVWNPDYITSQIGLAWPEAAHRGALGGSSYHRFVNHTAGFEREVKQITAVGRSMRILRSAGEFQANVVPIHSVILRALWLELNRDRYGCLRPRSHLAKLSIHFILIRGFA